MNSSSSSFRSTVETSRHDASHLRAPRGRGGWMFENQAGEHVFTFCGTYAESKRAALAWARANRVEVLYVCP